MLNIFEKPQRVDPENYSHLLHNNAKNKGSPSKKAI